jgi:WXG100 family type VII secretion target
MARPDGVSLTDLSSVVLNGPPHVSRERGDVRVSQTQSEAAVMRQTATRFEQVNESLQQMLSQLLSELEVLQHGWRGAGGRTFEQVKTQWAADQAALSRALAETAGAIRTAGQHYTASDDQAADLVARSTGGRLQLPL